MAGKRIVVPNYMPALDLNGGPVAGAKLYFWDNETTTLKAIYTSAALSVAHSNPVVANAAGVFPSIFADEAEEFSVAITDADDNPIVGLRNRDNIRPSLAFLDGIDVPVSDPMAVVLAEETLEAARTSFGIAPPVLPSQFGLFTSATVTTATLLAAVTYAMANARPIELSGSYTINGPITPTTAVDGAELHLLLRDNVTITVDSGATAFNRVFYAESTTAKSHTIGGPGTLTINGNSKAAAGIWLRHTEGTGTATAGGATTLTDSSKTWTVNAYAGRTVTIATGTGAGQTRTISSNTATVLTVSVAWATNPDATSTYAISLEGMGGSVIINAPVHVKNLKSATGVTNAVGIMVLGRYERIVMRSPTVEDVTRTDATGECSGITCSGFDGEVEMYSPVVRRINFGALGSGDADCIKCLARNPGTSNNRREGSVRIFNPVLEDGQTRLYKDQCGDTVIYSPWARRRAVDGTAGTFTGAASVDFDFQYGGGLVLDAHIEYYKSAASVSPFSGSHSIFAFQQLADNSEMYGAARNTTVITNVAMTRAVQVAEGGSRSTTEISGLKVIPISGFTTTAFTDAVVEINAGQILAKTTETIINVTGVDAPNTNPIIGYRGYTGSTVADFVTKFSFRVANCSTSLAISGQTTRAISDIADNAILAYKSMEIGDNPGYRNWYSNITICPKKLRAGTKMSIYLDNSSFVDTDWATPVAVPWGVTGTLYLECDGVCNFGTTANDTVIKAYLDNATATPSVWFTQYGGVTWGAIK